MQKFPFTLLPADVQIQEMRPYQKGWSWEPVQFSFSSVTQSCPTLWPHELQHTRPPCPSPTPGVHPNSCPSSQWCHRAISSSVVPWSSWPQSLPASELFPVSLLFAWGGQSIGSFKCLLGLILVNNLRVPSIESMTASSLPAEDSFFIWHVWKGWLIGT